MSRLTLCGGAAVALGLCVSTAMAQQTPPPSTTPLYPPNPYQQPYPQYPQQPAYIVTQPAPHESLFHWHIDGGWSGTSGQTQNYLQGGYSVGVGFSVAAAPGSPIGFRFDVNYDHHNATQQLIALNQNPSGTINSGDAAIWNGTIDLEIRIPFSGGVRGYVFGGPGYYNTTLSFREPTYSQGGYYGSGGNYCDPFFGYCGGGYGETKAASHEVSKFGWNAGVGLEVPLAGQAKWFVEGRYNRVQETSTSIPLTFIPVTIGVRF
jgi:opacity protein-like surface antigen